MHILSSHIVRDITEKQIHLTSHHRIREKNDWYTTRRVVVRKRNGRIHLSRLGSRQEQASNGYGSDFTLIDEPIPGRSSSSSFSSTFSS